MPAVVIAGGGYAGVAAARYFERYAPADWRITLIDRRPAHELLTRLPEVLAARIDPDMARIPYGLILGRSVRVIQTEVMGVDAARRRVLTAAGVISADWLVLALGARAADWASFAPQMRLFPVRSVDAALGLRRAVVAAQSEHPVVGVVVVGGGYTGSEVAAELATWPGGAGRIAVTLIAEERRLLGQGNERMAAAAARILARQGVSLLLGRSVRSMGEQGVKLDDDTLLSAHLIVWATPAEAAPEARGVGATLRLDGRVEVDESLRVPDRQGIYAAGDVAAGYDYVHGRPVASSAQLAIQEGELAARNILAESKGMPLHPFRPRVIGEALTLGGEDGVAEVLGVIVTGGRARAVKETALARYLFRLGGPKLVGRYVSAGRPGLGRARRNVY